MSKSFTLIELLVVVSIIVLMTALTLPNYRLGDKQLALQRSAHRLAQTLRTTQEYAISAKTFQGAVPSGYGMYLDLAQPASYILFADVNGDGVYSGASEKVEGINLEVNVVLGELVPATPSSSLTIVFIPPDPTTIFNPDATSAKITLKAKGTETAAQYMYNSDPWLYWVWNSPRAGCDTSSSAYDCPSSFSASPSDPTFVYDWGQTCIFGWWCFSTSKRFTKSESQPVTVQQKTVEVNKAGLIAVE